MANSIGSESFDDLKGTPTFACPQVESRTAAGRAGVELELVGTDTGEDWVVDSLYYSTNLASAVAKWKAYLALRSDVVTVVYQNIDLLAIHGHKYAVRFVQQLEARAIVGVSGPTIVANPLAILRARWTLIPIKQ